MQSVQDASGPKEAVTIRVDKETKGRLTQLAGDQNRTFSSLVDMALREFVDRHFPGGSATVPDGKLNIRHAHLPDTCVLRAFQKCAPDLFSAAVIKLNLPRLEFVEDRPEWRRLPSDLYSGESDLIESMNLAPIYEHVTHGRSSSELRLDWIGPFLQVFVGHCVFVRKDSLTNYIDPTEIKEFEQFRLIAQTGRELSLRSLIAWVQQSGSKVGKRAQALERMWSETVVGCQTGTDYHIAVRRVAPILAALSHGQSERTTHDPTISDIDNLDRGFQELRSGAVAAFTGNLLHSATLLAEAKPTAVLLAGPADLRVPSLNTLAGRKGMFDVSGGQPKDQPDPLGVRLLEFWGQAIGWFRDQVVNADSDEGTIKFIELLFPEFDMQELTDVSRPDGLKPLAVFRSLMQTWVKWFTDPEDARAFVGLPNQALSEYYARLCELLNPLKEMVAPQLKDEKERAIWKFPVLAGQSGKSPISGSPADAVTSEPAMNTVPTTGKSGSRSVDRTGKRPRNLESRKTIS